MNENPIRQSCILCESKTTDLFKIKLPIFMGATENITNSEDFDISLVKCQNCGEVQIKELIDLNIIYQNNHNINVVGDIWNGHYIEIANFIKKDISNKTILEISDPSAKIARLSSNFISWDIIEPNPEDIKIKDVNFIKAFFDEDFKIEKKDIIIHSHLLEHIYYPMSFFRHCFNILNDNGMMIFSIPDMDFLLNSGYSPCNILHFEHTYFVNKDIIEYIASKTGFKIIESFNYKNHSIFFKLKKEISIENNTLKLSIAEKFQNNFNYHLSNIKSINQFVKNNQFKDFEIYIFGAHVSSQFYISNGLDVSQIKNIIDNAPSKINKYLFGTNLQIRGSESLSNKKCIIICSHIGIYFDEVVSKLLQINPKIIII